MADQSSAFSLPPTRTAARKLPRRWFLAGTAPLAVEPVRDLADVTGAATGAAHPKVSTMTHDLTAPSSPHRQLGSGVTVAAGRLTTTDDAQSSTVTCVLV